jgi:predicted dehydrogenase/threonine dehydrogenase-like Zn-dependent dehydrogenase
MKQVFRSPKGIEVQDVAIPTPGEKEILVAVHTSVISTGTETSGMRNGGNSLFEKLIEKKELLDKVRNYIKENGLKETIEVIKSKLSPKEQTNFFKPIGYSNAGVVVAKGHLVTSFNVGDRVACAGSGIAAHAEFTTIPINLAVKIPDNVEFETAGFTTIGAIAMQGIRRANVTFGETIVITGLGLIGLLAVQIAKAWGLVVIGTDLNEKRLQLAKEMGADFCFSADNADVVNSIKRITGGYGADAVVIYAATSSSVPANMAMEVCRRKGRVVVVGAIGMDLDREAMYAKELDFVMSTSYGAGRYDDLYELKGIDYPIGYVRWTENRNMMEFVRLLDTGQVKVDKLISNKFDIISADEAYKSLIEHPGENIASIFNYAHNDYNKIEQRKEMYPRPIPTGKIRVGVIGAGSFTQRNHLANMLNMPEDFEIIAVANKTPASAKLAGDKYKARYVTTDYHQLLKDPDIDLIVIGTRHNLHAQQVVDSINAGKHVLVEKPLAMNPNELDLIQNAINNHPQVTALVGFNRRYSPLIQKAKKIIEKDATPIVINYRVNAGYFAPEVWVQNLEEGGGRIIGEACHFIDLISYLSNSNVSKITAVHIPTDSKTIQSEDNVIVSIAYENGSIGVLTYTSIGGKDMEKEKIEIFSNGSSLVINDFIELLVFNCEENGLKLKETDKGHKTMISELSKKLKNNHSLILPFDEDIKTTGLTLEVIDTINSI